MFPAPGDSSARAPRLCLSRRSQTSKRQAVPDHGASVHRNRCQKLLVTSKALVSTSEANVPSSVALVPSSVLCSSIHSSTRTMSWWISRAERPSPVLWCILEEMRAILYQSSWTMGHTSSFYCCWNILKIYAHQSWWSCLGRLGPQLKKKTSGLGVFRPWLSGRVQGKSAQGKECILCSSRPPSSKIKQRKPFVCSKTWLRHSTVVGSKGRNAQKQHISRRLSFMAVASAI